MGHRRGKLRRVRAILFDVGDTLFRLGPMDEPTMKRRLSSAVGHRTGMPAADAAATAEGAYRAVIAAIREGYRTHATAEPSIAGLAAPLFSKFGPAGGDLAEDFDRIFGEADTARWIPTPEREAHLAGFAAAGLELAFVSNTLTAPALMRARLTEFGLLHHPKVHVFSVAVGERKPSPAIYRAALDGLGIGPR